ncbi:MAG: BREX system Lon protease-like protein BrxL [Bacteroidales bacterium]
MKTLDEKIKQAFPDESVIKIPQNYSVFAGKNLPSFIKDFLIKRYTDNYGNLDRNGIIKFLFDHIPSKDNNLKNRLRTHREEVTVLARLIIETDLKNDRLLFSIPDLGIKPSEGRIPNHVAKKNKELKDGELWGVITLIYQPPADKEKGYIELINYKAFKPYKVDLDYFCSARSEFSTLEWIDLLIRSMEYNPEGFESISQKLMFLSRLLIFVEPRLNLIELAPKGTGKSYVFGNLSKYGWLISGGVVSRAKLFYDMQRKSLGMITLYDFITLDEIQTIRFTDSAELRAALKSFLEQGYTNIMGTRVESLAGFLIMGNISLSIDNKPVGKKYFSELPDTFKESALLERFHGFVEGWRLPRFNTSLLVHGYTLNVEYFSEILHELRNISLYATIVDDLIDIPPKSDGRHVTAIKRLSTAYLKLLFPNVRNASEINKDDFNNFCLQPAIEKRKIILEQLRLIDPEYSQEKFNIPNIKIK